MTFLEALYGSQYEEIHLRGGDGSKARFNGNLLLAVMILLGILVIFLAAIKFVPGFNETITRQVRALFGYSSGKTIGRLLALPSFSCFSGLCSKQPAMWQISRNRWMGLWLIRKRSGSKETGKCFFLSSFYWGC